MKNWIESNNSLTQKCGNSTEMAAAKVITPPTPAFYFSRRGPVFDTLMRVKYDLTSRVVLL